MDRLKPTVREPSTLSVVFLGRNARYRILAAIGTAFAHSQCHFFFLDLKSLRNDSLTVNGTRWSPIGDQQTCCRTLE